MTARIALVVQFSAAVAVSALTPQAPGTGRISGIVVTNDAAPQPVRRAIVTVRGEGLNGPSAISDDQGRFTVDGLPAGRFTIAASKPAHITTAFGAKGPGRPGTPITLGADQAIANLRLVLPRGAAISGTVRDQTGEPASTVHVFVTRIDGSTAGTASRTMTPEVTTDDRGMFRAYGLAPGTYTVAAAPRAINLSGSLRVMSAADVDAAMQAQQARGGRGGSPAPAPGPSTTPPLSGYVPIFHPGTSVAAEAARITVAAGDDRQGVDIPLILVPMSTIEGKVVNPAGPLPELTLTISAGGPSFPGLLGMTPSFANMTGGRVGVNGSDSFKYTNVAPGRYTIFAQTSNTRTTVTPTGFSSTRIAPGTDPMLWGATEIEVSGHTASNVVLQLQPAMTISGRVAFSGASLTPPGDLTTVRVTVAPVASVTEAAAGGRGAGPGGGQTLVKADGTFEATGLVPGSYTLNAAVPGAAGPAGWWLRSATAGARDLLDAPLDLGPAGNLSDVVLTLSDRHNEITGTLQAAAGVPAPEYFVLAFPADPALRRAERRLRTTRPSNDGRFSFADLPPGDYLLAALTDVVGNEWQDPAFLVEVARSGAVRVTLGEGEKRAQNLRIGGG